MTDPPTAADCNTDTEARAGMGPATLMTRARAAAKNAFTTRVSVLPLERVRKNCSRAWKNEGPLRKKIHRNREIAGVKTVGGWEHMGS